MIYSLSQYGSYQKRFQHDNENEVVVSSFPKSLKYMAHIGKSMHLVDDKYGVME
ncbi:predicted protein [Sclerotinia sclerotiorum 1980 UF-70]|uniref:Uncharacterized protein n=1 Tax=Sclerotinia sclerotiorum (strain ATCC 18683 / 1980 / Ss-1) TaxID=665079 RepID=A7F5W5_SCLS1|nr:predicted protein [Sclerotinia sclerotiorum 1980 UF-70]EDN98136.1 predicted protein [Sclerotinia sclerotiorum 1980 UF-70]